MEEGFVYFMVDWGSNPEKYKIGVTKNEVEKRKKQLQTGASEEIVILRKYKSKNYKKIETFLKRSYKHYATNGGKEWFQLPNDIACNFLEDCIKAEKMFESLNDNPFIK